MGAGPPLVLLSQAPLTEALWPSVTSAIAAGNRVYVPEVGVWEGDFASWLRSFMDGVGAEVVSLVAVGDLCISALEFALLQPDRIGRLILVPSGRSAETGLEGSLIDEKASATLPILLLHREHGESAAAEVVKAFFARH